MANAPRVTSAGTRQPEGAENAGPLEHSEVTDARDTSPRVKGDTSGKRVRAVFYGGATTVEIEKKDFADHGIDHPTVRFDFRKSEGTLAVKDGKNCLSAEAADYLTENFPTEFEYIGE